MEPLDEKLAKGIAAFGAQLGSSKMGTLTQAWVPESGEDGGVVLNTQGLPFCVNGTGDLLALFRCISCKYKFSTDTTKPWLMGPVGRVYTNGEPEITRSVQDYDQSVYLRVAEAQRCHVNCCLFLPVYASAAKDRVAAVLEVVQTEDNARFPGLVDWARVCLEGVGLWTTAAQGDSLVMGLRAFKTEFEASAFESKVEARGAAKTAATGAASMPPPPAPATALRQGNAPSHTHSMGSVQPLEDAGRGGTAAANNDWASAAATAATAAAGSAPAAADADDAPGGSGHTRSTLEAAVVPPKDHVVQVGNNLMLACDAAAMQQAWPHHPGSGSGGSSEPITQHHACPLTSMPPPLVPNGDPQAGGGHAAPGTALWGVGGGALGVPGFQMPQGYATTYGHGDRAITIDDLAPHFHVSLRDAASRMGISVTTLKRACRRLGLQRWPRRELSNRAQEASAAAAAVAAVAAAHAVAGDPNLLSWTSGQTISADSSGDLLAPSRAAAAVAQAHAVAAAHGGMLLPFGAAHPAALRPAMLPPMFGGPGAPLPGGSLSLGPPGSGGPPAPAGTAAGQSGPSGVAGEFQAHSLESLDILAAADVDTFSVGNSPHGDGMFSTGGNVPGAAVTGAPAAPPLPERGG